MTVSSLFVVSLGRNLGVGEKAVRVEAARRDWRMKGRRRACAQGLQIQKDGVVIFQVQKMSSAACSTVVASVEILASMLVEKLVIGAANE